jgi:hypothetical protein
MSNKPSLGITLLVISIATSVKTAKASFSNSLPSILLIFFSIERLSNICRSWEIKAIVFALIHSYKIKISIHALDSTFINFFPKPVDATCPTMRFIQGEAGADFLPSEGDSLDSTFFSLLLSGKLALFCL